VTSERTYRLPERRTGTVLLGFAVPQLLFAACGTTALVVLPALTRSGLGALAGLVVAAGCVLLGFAPVAGQPAYQAAVTLAGFTMRQAAGGRRGWVAPLRPHTGAPAPGPARRWAAEGRSVPRCLAGLQLLAVERPGWAGAARTAAPVGLVADRRSGTLTVVLGVRGSGFSLLDPPDQHRRLSGWAQVLSQFARERSPVTRLGWSLWSTPDTNAVRPDGEAMQDQAGSASAGRAEYDRLAAQVAAGLVRHELRVWLTVDPRQAAGSADLPQLALAAARALTDRCAAAGLVCAPPMSPVQLAEAMRVQADPSAAAALAAATGHVGAGGRVAAGGLAERAGLASPLTGPLPDVPDPAAALPLAVRADWDAVQVDGAWHRVFWVARWPAGWLPAGWWEPLLADRAGTRTLAVVMEPVPARASRRRINAESVSIDGQLRLRDKHAFRVPVGLQQAHSEVDDREAELNAGYPEYAYLALVSVTAPTRDQLDAACHAALDTAARCGIVELRPLHGRHDTAWACTLPLGRAPDRDLFGALR
jgi:hypothetical protein